MRYITTSNKLWVIPQENGLSEIICSWILEPDNREYKICSINIPFELQNTEANESYYSSLDENSFINLKDTNRIIRQLNGSLGFLSSGSSNSGIKKVKHSLNLPSNGALDVISQIETFKIKNVTFIRGKTFLSNFSLRKTNVIRESIPKLIVNTFIHDLNNIYHTANMHMELMLAKIENNNWNYFENLQGITDALSRQIDLTRFYSEFSAKSNNQMINSADLVKIIRKISLALIRTENIKFDISVENNLTLEGINSVLIDTAISNLVKNSCEAMNNCGELIIDIINKQPSREIIKLVNSKTKYCQISITDSGPGFTKDEIKKSLMPYYTTKSNGNGLGLLSVINCMEQVNGIVAFDLNNKGRGAIIDLFIPLAA